MSWTAFLFYFHRTEKMRIGKCQNSPKLKFKYVCCLGFEPAIFNPAKTINHNTTKWFLSLNQMFVLFLFTFLFTSCLPAVMPQLPRQKAVWPALCVCGIRCDADPANPLHMLFYFFNPRWQEKNLIPRSSFFSLGKTYIPPYILFLCLCLTVRLKQ